MRAFITCATFAARAFLLARRSTNAPSSSAISAHCSPYGDLSAVVDQNGEVSAYDAHARELEDPYTAELGSSANRLQAAAMHSDFNQRLLTFHRNGRGLPLRSPAAQSA